MALLPNVFTPEQAADNPFAPIDAGWYACEMRKSLLKATKNKDGKYLACDFIVVDEDSPADGRKLYTNLNLVNKNEIAVKIAESDLKKMCIAAGRDEADELEDSEDLHDILMMVKVSVKAETADWPAKNELKDYLSIEAYEAMLDEQAGD